MTLALCQDIQAHAYDYPVRFFEERAWSIERRLPRPERIAQALEMIQSAQRPMIIAGGGVLYAEAEAELAAVAQLFGIPVGETVAGKGAMQEDTLLTLGGVGVSGAGSAGKLIHEADLVLCVGTRLTDFATGSQSAFQHPDVKFVSINVNGHDAYKQGALAIVADAREALAALLAAGEAAGARPNPAYLEEIAVVKQEWQGLLAREVFVPHAGEAMSAMEAIQVLNEEAQAGDTVVAAAGAPPSDLHQVWDTSGGRHCHLEFGYSCMGYEIPAGLGVRMTQPEGEVYVIVGDGTYLMQPSELVTAVQEGLKITVVVMNNHGFQIIRRLQMGKAGISFGNEFRARDELRESPGRRLPGHRLRQECREHGGEGLERRHARRSAAGVTRGESGDAPLCHRGRDRTASLRAVVGGVVGRCAGRGER